jgi:dihydrofolate reductase
MLSIIVAIDKNNGIGKDNSMPWHLSDDLKRFKAITMGHTVIMGRNTWLSLPFKPLKGRRNIVISTNMAATDGCEIARSIEEAHNMVANEELAFIMGGARIYQQTIDIADELIVTHIHKAFDGIDTHFPTIDPTKWEIKERSEILFDQNSELEYQYVTYKKINR